MTDEKQIECDGFLVESPYDYYVICGLNADEAWAQLVKAEYKNLSDMNDISGYIEALKRQGYTVRPVCFVSPSDKRYLDMRKKIHREALFEQMREETTD